MVEKYFFKKERSQHFYIWREQNLWIFLLVESGYEYVYRRRYRSPNYIAILSECMSLIDLLAGERLLKL